MNRVRIDRLLLAGGVLMAAGCATTVRYSPDLVAQRIQQVGAPMPGKVLIHTTEAQDAGVYRGRPKSFAGSAVAVNIPFGKMTRDIALKTFHGNFSQGAVASDSMSDAAAYRVIIMPQVTHFDYLYRPAPGSLISMVADGRMKLRVKALSPDAVVLVDKEYDSSRVISEPTAGYLPTVLGQLAHTTLCDLMADVARDVKLAVLQQSMAPGQSPVPVYVPQPVYTPVPAPLPDPVQVIPDPVVVD